MLVTVENLSATILATRTKKNQLQLHLSLEKTQLHPYLQPEKFQIQQKKSWWQPHTTEKKNSVVILLASCNYHNE
jgi:hypothetical protein